MSKHKVMVFRHLFVRCSPLLDAGKSASHFTPFAYFSRLRPSVFSDFVRFASQSTGTPAFFLFHHSNSARYAGPIFHGRGTDRQ